MEFFLGGGGGRNRQYCGQCIVGKESVLPACVVACVGRHIQPSEFYAGAASVGSSQFAEWSHAAQ